MRTPALNAVNRKGTSHVPHPHGVIAWAGTETKSFVCWARHDLPRLWYEIPLSVSVSVSLSLSLSLCLHLSSARWLAWSWDVPVVHITLNSDLQISLVALCAGPVFIFFSVILSIFLAGPFAYCSCSKTGSSSNNKNSGIDFPPHSSFPCVRCR